MIRIVKIILSHLIGFTVAFGIFGIGLIFYLQQTREAKGSDFLLTPLFIVMIIGRIWESFFTSKEPERRKIDKDWCLALVTVGYSVLLLIAAVDYYLRLSPVYVDLTVLGLIMYFAAFGLRRWGIRSLAHQWSIHAVGENRLPLEGRELVREGPYKYIRHPIYSGIFLEILAIPLIANSLYAFLFSAVILVPIYGWRAALEERMLMRLFGWGYKQYRKEIPAFVPIQSPPEKVYQDRRLRQIALVGLDRRGDDRRRTLDRRRRIAEMTMA